MRLTRKAKGCALARRKEPALRVLAPPTLRAGTPQKRCFSTFRTLAPCYPPFATWQGCKYKICNLLRLREEKGRGCEEGSQRRPDLAFSTAFRVVETKVKAASMTCFALARLVTMAAFRLAAASAMVSFAPLRGSYRPENSTES